MQESDLTSIRVKARNVVSLLDEWNQISKVQVHKGLPLHSEIQTEHKTEQKTDNIYYTTDWPVKLGP